MKQPSTTFKFPLNLPELIILKVYGSCSWLHWLLELTWHWSMETILLFYGNRIKLWGKKSPTILLPFLINICVYEDELGKKLVIHEKSLSGRAGITLKKIICLAESVRYTDFPAANLFPCPSFGSCIKKIVLTDSSHVFHITKYPVQCTSIFDSIWSSALQQFPITQDPIHQEAKHWSCLSYRPLC